MSFLKKTILKLVGRRKIEFLRSKPFLVHGKYRTLINDLEKYSDIITRSTGVDPAVSLLMVRKFGHILDKGLQRSDVERGHSGSIAGELHKHIEIAEKEFSDDPTLLWAKEKLELYNELQVNGLVTIKEEHPEPCGISLKDFDLLLRNRRSNRSFQRRVVSSELIGQLARTVNWASSSCNKQPIVMYATTDPELARECLKCCKGGTGFSDFVPVFVSFTADMRGYYLPDEAYVPAIDVALGVQNFLLSAELTGLSVTTLSWALKDIGDETRLRELLSIPEHNQIIINAVLGYPERHSGVPVRKGPEHSLFLKGKGQ